MSKVEQRFINPNIRVNPLLDRQIEALEQGLDLKSHFDQDELKEISTLGVEEYLAVLRRIKASMNDTGSEE